MRQPYEGLLPYSTFSVRTSKAALPQLMDTLAAITPAAYARLQRGLEQHWRAFVWDARAGGQAYALALTSLQRVAEGAAAAVSFVPHQPTGG